MTKAKIKWKDEKTEGEYLPEPSHEKIITEVLERGKISLNFMTLKEIKDFSEYRARLKKALDECAEMERLELLARYGKALEAEYEPLAGGFAYGTRYVNEGDCAVKAERPKETAWDQAELEKLYYALKDKFGGIVEAKFSVKESVYKNLEGDLREAVGKAREAKPGKLRLSVCDRGESTKGGTYGE